MATFSLSSWRLGRCFALLAAVCIVVASVAGSAVMVVLADVMTFGGGDFSAGDGIFVAVTGGLGIAAAAATAWPWFRGPEPTLTVDRDELVVTYPGLGVPLRLPRHLVDGVLLAGGRGWRTRVKGAADLLLWRNEWPNVALVLSTAVPTTAAPWSRSWCFPGWWRGGRPVRVVRIRVRNLAEARFALSAWPWAVTDEAGLAARLGGRAPAFDQAQVAVLAAVGVVLSLLWLVSLVL